jgi:hypothetical protein
MANVKRFDSPREMLDYVNSLTLPIGGFTSDLKAGDTFDIIDTGGYYTVIEDPGGPVTTLKSDRDLLDFLNAGATSNFRFVVPKREGGELTYISLTDETLGGSNGYEMIIVESERDLEEQLQAVIDGGSTEELIIEHDNKTIILWR